MEGGQGETGEAIAAARAALARRDAALTEADRQLADILAAAHRTAGESARRLDGIGAEIDAAAGGQFTDSPHGAREAARLLLARQREMADIVGAAARESAARTLELQRLHAQYQLGR